MVARRTIQGWKLTSIVVHDGPTTRVIVHCPKDGATRSTFDRVPLADVPLLREMCLNDHRAVCTSSYAGEMR
jgi:hypothetical protein